MKTSIRYILLIITLASLSAIAYGFFHLEEEPSFAHKYIGFGTLGLFLVAMPLFLLTAGRGKKMKDYMLTEENIRKMRKSRDKNPDTQ
ncbi:MAG: hypothetical protein ABF293_08510 [Flavobacteriaceae bacterium]